MKLGKKLLIIAILAIGMADLIIIAVCFFSPPREPPAERRARRLWAEIRELGQIETFLIEIRFKSRPDRRHECTVVRELGALGPPAVPYLIRALDHGMGHVREWAAVELGNLGPEAGAAAPKLLDVMKHDHDDYLRLAAAEALVRIGRGGAALPVLAKRLRSSDEFDRSAAARVLGNLGPLAEPVIPELIGALEDVDREVRDKASDALARIGPPAVPALVKALEHRDSTVREHATWALGQIRPGAAAATPAYHLVYVIDRSGSMVDRLHRVKIEVLSSIGRLKESQDFHVVFYGMSPEGGPAERLLPATEENKLKAVGFVRGFRAKGQTDPVPALKRAFGVLGQADPKRPGKLIYLVTDGVFPDNEKVLKVIRRLNAGKDAHIHTVLVGKRHPVAVKVMKTIASENGGYFKHVEDEDIE